MTDKERLGYLEQIIDFQLTNSSHYGGSIQIILNSNDVEWLTKQAKRVQELESSVDMHMRVAHRNIEQNKRYREAIESVKNKLDTVHFREYQTVDFRHEMFIELLEALEGEE